MFDSGSKLKKRWEHVSRLELRSFLGFKTRSSTYIHMAKIWMLENFECILSRNLILQSAMTLSATIFNQLQRGQPFATQGTMIHYPWWQLRMCVCVVDVFNAKIIQLFNRLAKCYRFNKIVDSWIDRDHCSFGWHIHNGVLICKKSDGKRCPLLESVVYIRQPLAGFQR